MCTHCWYCDKPIDMSDPSVYKRSTEFEEYYFCNELCFDQSTWYEVFDPYEDEEEE